MASALFPSPTSVQLNTPPSPCADFNLHLCTFQSWLYRAPVRVLQLLSCLRVCCEGCAGKEGKCPFQECGNACGGTRVTDRKVLAKVAEEAGPRSVQCDECEEADATAYGGGGER